MVDSEANEAGAAEPEAEESMEFAAFLETVPPHVTKRVEDSFVFESRGTTSRTRQLARPSLRIECPRCEGPRRFISLPEPKPSPVETGTSLHSMEYTCVDCAKEKKIFALRVVRANNGSTAMKVGEYPAFGERVPNRVLKILGADKDLMLNGRKSENLGLGIGAFAYYRLAVERSKDRILEKFRSAAVGLGAKPEVLDAIDEALREHRFTAALDAVPLPDELLVNGQNPFKVLHTPTSKALHPENLTDERCLKLARSVRLVLVELVRRVQRVMEEGREVDEAVRELLAAAREFEEAPEEPAQ